MRRGQAALEYLVTYGWAFLVILIVIGGLAYFGFLSPSKFLPDRCELGQQLECVDWEVIANSPDTNDGHLNLYVRNNFGVDIWLKKISVIGAQDLSYSRPYHPRSMIINADDTKDIELTNIKSGLLLGGEKQQLKVEITFAKRDTSNWHTLRGLVYARVKEPSSPDQ